MKLDRIDAEGKRLEDEVNRRLREETPGWPKLAVEQETARVVREVLGDDWTWLTRCTLNGATQIHVTQFIGEIER